MKTYSFKLYTNKLNTLHRQINIAGIIYNYCINMHKRYYSLYGKSLSKYTLQKHLTKKKKKYTFWNQVGSQAIQDITDRIDRAYKLFFRNLKHDIKTAPPGFKKVKKYRSFTLKQAGYKFLETNKIKIGKKVYRYSKSREIEGTIKTLTIKRDSLGDIYIFSVTDYVESRPTTTGKMAGCDFGLKTFLTMSDSTKIESPLFYKQSLKQLKKSSKKYSSKKKGSKNQKRARLDLTRKHKKIFNQRKDHHFKLAKKLTESHDYLFFETLNLKGMQRLWGRKVSDLGFYSFLLILESQANKYSCKIHYIDRFYPSSKECSCCGKKNDNLQLSDRHWYCPSCQTKHDRDINASLNILREGASSFGVEIVRPAFVG